MALEKADIVAAALAILDDYGLADLSMRRVADALGVKAGALYWHVANKQTLLAAVADQVLAQVSDVDAGQDPRRALVAWAQDLRRVLLGHRDSAELVATALASGLCQVDPVAGATDLLGRSGSAQEAAWGAGAVLHLVLGHVAEEQNVQLFSQLGSLGPVEANAQGEAFDHGVEALVRGLVEMSTRRP